MNVLYIYTDWTCFQILIQQKLYNSIFQVFGTRIWWNTLTGSAIVKHPLMTYKQLTH